MSDKQKRSWQDIFIGATVTAGLSGSILSYHSKAADSPQGKSGFMPGTRLLTAKDSPSSDHLTPPSNPSSPSPAKALAKSQQKPKKSKEPQRSSASAGPGTFFFDDDDDDDDDFDDVGGNRPSRFGGHGFQAAAAGKGLPARPSEPPNAISVGGQRGTDPDPVITSSGVMVGGGTSNGVISKNKTAPFHLDEETGEGSKAIITDFNYPEADIMDIAKTMGKLTGKNFILDKDIKGKITIISNAPITVGAAWKAFLTALDMNGFALIPSGDFLRIARQRDARDKQLNTYTGDRSPDTDALITRVFSLKYISAEEVARTFRNFVPANSRIIPYEQTNTVIVTDTGSNIAKLAKMLEILDVEGFDAGIEVIPVRHASAVELSKLIDTLIPGTISGGVGGPPGMARFGGASAAHRFSARRTKEGGIINTIIGDERTNTLIVHANSKGADQVRELVAKLDQKLPSTIGGGKVHVIYLQFADAEQIANTLNNFSSQAATKSTGPAAAGGGTGSNPIATSLFEGAIRISPDKATNALVINASPADFVTVKRVIDRLDIPRDQIYVEVVIMEVGISRKFDYSANIANPKGAFSSITNSDLFSLIQNPMGSTGALFTLASGGQTTLNIGTTPITISSITGLIKAIQTHSNSNILATPQIIALDNSEANFESSEQIPVNSGTTVTGTGISQQNITKEPVVLSITIKPQINKATNFVKMDVTTKLGDIQNANVPAELIGRTFGKLERTAKTTVVVGDSDTVVLGGLIRDKITDSISKIPILGDIPLLGWLFKAKKSDVQKTNLLIFMTPHIIRPYEKIREILNKKLKERDGFIEENAGGEDPERAVTDEIIRTLPDIPDLMKKAPQSTYTIDEDKPEVAPTSPHHEPGHAAPAAVPVEPTPEVLNTTSTAQPAPMPPQPDIDPGFIPPPDTAPVETPPEPAPVPVPEDSSPPG